MRRLLFWPQLFRRPARDFFERAIELRDRLEADLQSDRADAKVWIPQKILRFLDPHPPQVINKGHPSRLLETLAEIGCAGIHRPRHPGEREFLSMMGIDKPARFYDGRRITLVRPKQQSVAAEGEMSGKNCQQAEQGLIPPWMQYPRLEESLFRGLHVHLNAPLQQGGGDLIELPPSRWFIREVPAWSYED